MKLSTVFVLVAYLYYVRKVANRVTCNCVNGAHLKAR
jgi:hypothetical protein